VVRRQYAFNPQPNLWRTEIRPKQQTIMIIGGISLLMKRKEECLQLN
jgi:hypothetical protein